MTRETRWRHMERRLHEVETLGRATSMTDRLEVIGVRDDRKSAERFGGGRRLQFSALN
jgi:hypothetical protein